MTDESQISSPEAVPRLRRLAGLDSVIAIGVGIVAMVIATIVLRVWVGSISVPLNYVGDSNPVLMSVKSAIEGGWTYENDLVGAPFGLENYDFPNWGHLYVAGFKVVGWLTGGDVGLTLNLNFLLGFLVIGAVGYWVLRRLDVSRPWAAALGVLYALTPFHFDRGVNHYYLSLYVAAPLGILLAVRQAQGTPAFVITDARGSRLGLNWRSHETRTALAVGVLSALTHGYFAVFTAVILLAVALVTFIATRERVRALSTLFVAAFFGVSLVAAMAPTIAYRLEHGPNPETVRRLYAEGDRYALKPLTMLLPIDDHRIPLLRKPMERSLIGGLRSEPGQNLGIVGALGLAGLVMIGMGSLIGAPGRFSIRTRLFSGLAIGITLASVAGGFSLIFGLLGMTLIRAWNRISPYVGFVALAALGTWLTVWWRARPSRLVWVIAAGLVLVGAYDQTAPVSDTSTLAREAEWNNDAAFVGEIEQLLPDGAMVYQLPYAKYPEYGPTEQMPDYDLLKGYLHSENLRWSYPVMRGRVPEWQAPLLEQDIAVVVEGLVAIGFQGLYIDRFGYADSAAALELSLRVHLGLDPLVSGNGRLLFFDLRPAAFELHSRFDEFEIEAIARRVLMVDQLPSE